LDASPFTALMRMSFAAPGATLPMFSNNGCVKDDPTKPMIDTKAMIAGNNANTPK